MDTFDFAMKMELQGKKFYGILAEAAALPGLKNVFLGLADDEQRHYEIFRDLKEGKQWETTDSVMLDQAKTVFQNFLADKEIVEGQLREDLDGYKLGLKAELESIKLYEDMAKKETDPEKIKLYLKIANEEKKHYNIIENICDFVMRPKYYLEWREFSNLHEL
jgi:rubrerythrin